MVERTKRPFNWGPVLCVVVGALAAPALIALSSAFDFGEIFYFFLGVPIVALTLSIFAFRKKTWTGWLLPVLLCLISWICWKSAYSIRTYERWQFGSTAFKAEVFAQPEPAKGEMKHLEWDGWGFAGAGDTNVYLVHDPNDSLLAASKSKVSGKFKGIPCEVYRVRRLEKQWYSVVFYTDTDWTHCP